MRAVGEDRARRGRARRRQGFRATRQADHGRSQAAHAAALAHVLEESGRLGIADDDRVDPSRGLEGGRDPVAVPAPASRGAAAQLRLRGRSGAARRAHAARECAGRTGEREGEVEMARLQGHLHSRRRRARPGAAGRRARAAPRAALASAHRPGAQPAPRRRARLEVPIGAAGQVARGAAHASRGNRRTREGRVLSRARRADRARGRAESDARGPRAAHRDEARRSASRGSEGGEGCGRFRCGLARRGRTQGDQRRCAHRRFARRCRGDDFEHWRPGGRHAPS